MVFDQIQSICGFATVVRTVKFVIYVIIFSGYGEIGVRCFFGTDVWGFASNQIWEEPTETD